MDLDVKNATLKDIFTGEVYTVSMKQLDNSFRPYFAQTCHSIQRMTTDKNVNIFNVQSDYITAKWLWVSVSRTTDLDHLNLIVNKNRVELDYDFDKMIESYQSQDVNAKRSLTGDFITKEDIKLYIKNKVETA